MTIILSKEYQDARMEVARVLATRVEEVDRIHDLAESLFRTNIRFSETVDRNRGTVDVLFLQLTKSLKTYRAIRATALEGCGHDAAVLLRVLFETCTAVQWLLQADTGRRAKMFAAHGDIRQHFVAQQQAETPGLEAIGASRLKQLEPVIADWRRELGGDTVDKLVAHWSGLGGLWPTAQKLPGWTAAYNTVYRGTSAPAHGSDAGDHANFSPGKSPVFKLLPGPDERNRVLTVAGLFLHTIATCLNGWLELGSEAELEAVTLARISVTGGARG